MKNTTKVILLSTFAFPGAGHFFLKHKKSGIIFFILFCSFTYPIINYAYQQTLSLLEKVIAGEITPSITVIHEYLLFNSNNTESIKLASYMLFFIWIVSVIDSYRLAKNK